MPDPVVPGPPASVLAAVSQDNGSALAPSNPAFTGRATFTGAAANAFPFLPLLMSEIVPMPQSAYIDADVIIAGNLTVNGTFVADTSALVTPTAVQTGAYAANPGDFVPCDTTSASFTVTLPSAPDDGAIIGVKQIKQASQHFVTVAASGSDVFNVAGGSASVRLILLNQGFLAQYNLAAGIWYILADAVPVVSGQYLRAPTVVTSGTFTTTSATLSALSAGTVATGAFIAPSSGEVVVEVDLVSNITAANTLGFALAATGTVTPVVGFVVTVEPSSSVPFSPYHLVFPVTGLTAGSVSNYDVLFGVTAAGTASVAALGVTSTTVAGGNHGSPVVVSVKAV